MIKPGTSSESQCSQEQEKPLNGRKVSKIEPPEHDIADPRVDLILTMLTRLAAEDLSARVTPGDSGDDLDAIMVGLNVLAQELEANILHLDGVMATQARDTEGFRLLAEMSSMLQAGATVEELYLVIADSLERLFPAASGALYISGSSRDELERESAWGGFPAGLEEPGLKASECWGMRRGRAHIVQGETARMRCGHVPESAQQAYLCVPVMGTDELAGLLHLRFAALEAETTESSQSLWDERERIAITAAEYMGLALAHSRLRKILQQQSVRDPLTDTFNRRYLEETLEREIRRAARTPSPICCLMIDIDHFKTINDIYGHAAGDALLKALAGLLKKSIRGSDIPARYGGDEFTLILPDTTLSDGQSRAEQIHNNSKSLQVEYSGKHLPAVTISTGVAAFPEHGATAGALLHAADDALYNAKHAGRDRVEVYSAKTQP